MLFQQHGQKKAKLAVVSFCSLECFGHLTLTTLCFSSFRAAVRLTKPYQRRIKTQRGEAVLHLMTCV